MDVRIRKGNMGKAEVRVPPSKSLSHRALIAAALAAGTSEIRMPAVNLDTEATRECLELFSAKIEDGPGGSLSVSGGTPEAYDSRIIDCGESGSTLRFLLPLFVMSGKKCVFRLHGRLAERPLDVYEEMILEQGGIFEKDGDLLTVKGKLIPGEITVRGDISSQFISGLLFALPLLADDSVLRVTGEFVSRSYVALTERVLSAFGIVIRDEGNTIYIPGRQSYRPAGFTVEGDDSAAAVFMALACLARKEIRINGVRRDSIQADRRMVRFLRNMGAGITEEEDACTVIPSELSGSEFDLRDCPDLGPVLFALAASAEGESLFLHAGRLRLKESDRIEAMKEELGKLGCHVRVEGDQIRIRGSSCLSRAVLDGHHDHRVVMALSVLAAGMDDWVTIRGAEAVNKSYPGFFEDLAAAGVTAEVTG